MKRFFCDDDVKGSNKNFFLNDGIQNLLQNNVIVQKCHLFW